MNIVQEMDGIKMTLHSTFYDGTNEKNKDLTKDWKNSNKEVTRTADYEIGLVFSPDETLQILEYNKKVSQPRGDISRTLCTISPEE